MSRSKSKIKGWLRGFAALALAGGAFSAVAQGKGGGSGGYFELSLNGSWYQYSNGAIEGEESTTKVLRGGAGFAYRMLSNTALELSYMTTQTNDRFVVGVTPTGQLTQRARILRTTNLQNISANLILYFTGKGTPFRPYVRGGGGMMIREQKVNAVDPETGAASSIVSSSTSPKVQSISADAGVGLSMFVVDSVAIEASFSVYATDLDKDEIFLHYAAAGGLRFVF